MIYTFADNAEKAWARGVQFRIVLETPQEALAQKKAAEFCGKNALCNIRFVPTHPKTVMGIYDEKEVFFDIAFKVNFVSDWTTTPKFYEIKLYYSIIEE